MEYREIGELEEFVRWFFLGQHPLSFHNPVTDRLYIQATQPLFDENIYKLQIAEAKCKQQLSQETAMTEYDPTIHTLLGRDAQRAGRRLDANPYRMGSMAYVQWELGYRNEAHPPRADLRMEEDVIPAGIEIGNCVAFYDARDTQTYFGWVQSIIKTKAGWGYNIEVYKDTYVTRPASDVQRYEDGEHWVTGDE